MPRNRPGLRSFASQVASTIRAARKLIRRIDDIDSHSDIGAETSMHLCFASNTINGVIALLEKAKDRAKRPDDERCVF